MQVLSPAIEAYPVHHLPIIKAYADQLGLVSLINHYVPTAMEVDAGTVVLALVLDTLSGQSAVPPGRVLRPARHRTALRQGRAPTGLERRYHGACPRSPLRLWYHAALHGLCGPGGHAVWLGASLRPF